VVMNDEYGILVVWLWQSTAEELGEIPNSSYSTFYPTRTGLGSKSEWPITKPLRGLAGIVISHSLVTALTELPCLHHKPNLFTLR
jgi:hypothetical protein